MSTPSVSGASESVLKTCKSEKPCAFIEKRFKKLREEAKYTDNEPKHTHSRHYGEQYGPPASLLNRYFRCGFKTTFGGVLKRVFAGIASIKKYEVTMIREYHSDKDDFEECSHDVDVDTCFIAEFNLQIDISEKMQNGRTLKESLDEAMVGLRRDSALIIKPPLISESPDEKTPEARHYESARTLERVQILKNSKVKVPGQNAVPFAAVTITIMILAYK